MKNYRKKFNLFIVLFFVSINFSLPKAYSSLGDALDHYGFTSQDQKKALESLLHQAFVIPANKAIQEEFPPRDTQETLNADIKRLVDSTQANLTGRKQGQERWDAQASNWMNENKSSNLKRLKTLGFIEAISPKQKQVDAVCILGALASRMAARLEYAYEQVQAGFQPKAVILLAGERYVTAGRDATEGELASIANSFHLDDWKKLTETHLMQYLYNNASLRLKDLPVHVIDTPKGNLPRPTTETTILELITWLKGHPEIKSITFVSNQPHVNYQKAMIDQVFAKQDFNHVTYEVIGSKVTSTNDIQPILEGLGSYLWAASPK